jgi:hypothetical protein
MTQGGAAAPLTLGFVGEPLRGSHDLAQRREAAKRGLCLLQSATQMPIRPVRPTCRYVPAGSARVRCSIPQRPPQPDRIGQNAEAVERLASSATGGFPFSQRANNLAVYARRVEILRLRTG